MEDHLRDCCRKSNRQSYNTVGAVVSEKRTEATLIATDGMSYLERLMARVGRFWKSPDFFDRFELGEEMLGQLPRCIKVELITVMQEWIQKNTHDRSVFYRSGENYSTNFSVRGDSGRFIFWTGRFKTEGELFALNSVESYSFTEQRWDPEWLDTETMNLRMPGETFPLSEKCTFEPDSWWCYHSHSRNGMDDPEWYLFSYHEG